MGRNWAFFIDKGQLRVGKMARKLNTFIVPRERETVANLVVESSGIHLMVVNRPKLLFITRILVYLTKAKRWLMRSCFRR